MVPELPFLFPPIIYMHPRMIIFLNQQHLILPIPCHGTVAPRSFQGEASTFQQGKPAPLNQTMPMQRDSLQVKEVQPHANSNHNRAEAATVKSDFKMDFKTKTINKQNRQKQMKQRALIKVSTHSEEKTMINIGAPINMAPKRQASLLSSSLFFLLLVTAD